MFNWLLNLQNKTDSYKKKVSLGASVGFTFLIIILWLTALLSGGGVGEKDSQVTVQDAGTPLDSLRSSFSAAADSLGDLFEGLTE